MRSLFVKLLVLATFAFWGVGSAKYLHEKFEHHGVCEADDDDDVVAPAAHSTQVAPASEKQTPVAHHPCFTCQSLILMAMDRPVAVIAPASTLEIIAVEPIRNWRMAVVMDAHLPYSTGPPLCNA